MPGQDLIPDLTCVIIYIMETTMTGPKTPNQETDRDDHKEEAIGQYDPENDRDYSQDYDPEEGCDDDPSGPRH